MKFIYRVQWGKYHSFADDGVELDRMIRDMLKDYPNAYLVVRVTVDLKREEA